MQNIEKELISEQKIIPVLKTRIFELSKLLAIKEKALKTAPEGNLRISKSNGVVQYYHKSTSEKTGGHYILAKNKRLAQQLAQKEYDKKVLDAAGLELKLLNRTLRQYEKLEVRSKLVEKIFLRLTRMRQKLIKPVHLSDEAFAAQWLGLSYEKKLFAEDSKKYVTARGDLVRSKSENIIADTLYHMSIPYRYEFPLELKAEDGRRIKLHPDFCCLNLRTRQEFYWEHFGMMDNPEYAEQTVGKLNLYARNGFFPGKNLIITAEASGKPLSTRLVEKIAEEYLS